MKSYINQIKRIKPWFMIGIYTLILMTMFINLNPIITYGYKITKILLLVFIVVLIAYLVDNVAFCIDKKIIDKRYHKPISYLIACVLMLGMMFIIIIFILPGLSQVMINIYNNLVHYLNCLSNYIKTITNDSNLDTKIFKEVNIKRLINDIKVNYHDIFKYLFKYTIVLVIVFSIDNLFKVMVYNIKMISIYMMDYRKERLKLVT